MIDGSLTILKEIATFSATVDAMAMPIILKLLSNVRKFALTIKVCYFSFTTFNFNLTEELIANITAHKRQLDVQISGVLAYNIQNDAINGNNCGNNFFQGI